MAGSVKLTPSGPLEMYVNFALRVSNAVPYDIRILTSFRNPTSAANHMKQDILLMGFANDTYFNIPDLQSVRDQFVPGNPTTLGNFPDWQLDVQYQIYMSIFDASNNLLSKGMEEMSAFEMSAFHHPLSRASPPWLVTLCSFGQRAAPCNQLIHIDRSLLVF